MAQLMLTKPWLTSEVFRQFPGEAKADLFETP